MKRRWAVLLAAAVALGCRSSQPTTNPFLRTTVPPPGTGQGAVVVPGEPYYPGGAPPAAAVPIDPAAPVMPVTPVPGAAPLGVPPAPLRNNKYSPPGGTYMYNQSSIERPKSVAPDAKSEASDDGEPVVAATSKPKNESQAESLDELQLPSVAHAVEQATRWVTQPDAVELTHADQSESAPSVASAVAATEPADHDPLPHAESPGIADPLASDRVDSAVASMDDQETVRLATTAPERSKSTSATVLRITAGSPASSQSEGSQLTLTADTQLVATSDSTREAMTPAEFARGWQGSQPRTDASRRSTSLGRSGTWRASASRPPLGSSAL